MSLVNPVFIGSLSAVHQTVRAALDSGLPPESVRTTAEEVLALETTGLLPRHLGEFRAALENGRLTREHFSKISGVLEGLLQSAAALDADPERFIRAVTELGRVTGPVSLPPSSLLTRRPPELREVTVLFTDFTGYTAASQKMRPDEAIHLLNGYFEIFENLVLSAGGHIDKWIGDAMMAVWGAPVSRENDTLKAVQTALLLQKAADAINRRLTEAGQAGFGLKIGLHRGEAVAGFVGGPKTSSYSLIGQTVNVAARTEPMAESGQVIITEAVYRQVERFFEVRPAGRLEGKKGRTHEVEALPLYQVLFERTGFSPSELRGDLLPLIGRTEEMRTITTGDGLVILEAAAGIGKTRLADEFRAWLRGGEKPVRVVDGLGDSLTPEDPYRAIGAVLSNLVGGLDFLGDAQLTVNRLKTQLGLAGNLTAQAVEPYALVLAHLLGVSLPNIPPNLSYLFGDAVLLKEMRVEAVTALFSSFMDSDSPPLVLILEDLHWFDKPSLDLLWAVVGRLNRRPLRVLGLGRPEFRQRPAEATLISLPPLSPESLDRMIDALVQRSPVTAASEIMTPEIRRLLIETFGNNTYLFRSMAQAILEGWKIRRDPLTDQVEFLAPGQESGRPAQYFLQSLIDTLTPETQRALRELSVLGSQFSEAEAQGLGISDLGRVLRELSGRDFIVSSGDGRRRFQNALVRDVAYGQLVRDEQKALHQKAAAVLEASSPPQPARIAHHYEAADLPEPASVHYGRAAENALQSAEYQSASMFAEKSFRLTADPGLRLGALLTRDEALFAARDPEREKLLADYKGLLDAEGLPAKKRAEIHRRRGLILVGSDPAAAAVEIDAGLEALGDEGRAEPVRGRLFNLLGNLRWNAADYVRAMEAYEEALAIARTADNEDLAAIAQTNRCTLAGILGDYGKALEAGAEAVRIRRAGDQKRSLVQLLNNFSSLMMSLGDYRRALELLEEALSLSDELKGFHRFYLVPNRGEALRLLGRAREAAHFLDGSLAVHERQPDHFMAGVHHVYLSQALDDIGAFREAVLNAEKALEIARTTKNKVLEATALFALSKIPDTEDIEEVHARGLEKSSLSLSLLDEVGYVPEFDLQILWNHARHLIRNKQSEDALAVISRARRELERRAATIPDDAARTRYLTLAPHVEIVRIHGVLSVTVEKDGI